MADAQRIAPPDLEPVQTELLRDVVEQGLVRDRRLRHAEAAKGTGHRFVGEIRVSMRVHVRHPIRAHGMNRHAVGHRRPPARVGAGVEHGIHFHGLKVALGIGAEARVHARRMALGAGHQAFGAGVHACHRPAEQPRRERDQRLHRQVELAAEAAATRGRHDAHLRGGESQHARHFVAVHAGRLGGDEDFDPVADAAGEPGFGLDVGVLDEAGFERAFGDRGAGGHRRRGVTATDPAFDQEVAGLVGLHQRRMGRARSIDADYRCIDRPRDRQ